MVRVRVPATTANLGPGFDCLGMALGLYNEISMEALEEPRLEISSGGPAAVNIAADDSNLVYRAAARVFEKVGRRPAGLRMVLDIQAPLARGLGSSASAIVGGMFAANALLGQPLSQAELAYEATLFEGHPDNVVPCLVGGLTASLQLADRVLYQWIAPADALRFVVFIPDYELETATARGVMPKEVSIKDAVFNGSRIPFVLSALENGDLDTLGDVMNDRLHQPYRIPLIKGYEAVAAAAKGAGAAAVCISGAGPTILAVTDEESAEAVASAGKEALRNVGVEAVAKILVSDLQGCILLSD